MSILRNDYKTLFNGLIEDNYREIVSSKTNLPPKDEDEEAAVLGFSIWDNGEFAPINPEDVKFVYSKVVDGKVRIFAKVTFYRDDEPVEVEGPIIGYNNEGEEGTLVVGYTPSQIAVAVADGKEQDNIDVVLKATDASGREAYGWTDQYVYNPENNQNRAFLIRDAGDVVTVEITPREGYLFDINNDNWDPQIMEEYAEMFPDATVTTVSNKKVILKFTAPIADGAFAILGRIITSQVATEIEIVGETTDIYYGYDPIELTANATAPEGAVVPELNWSSSDAAIATVDNNGVVTGVAIGEATITATAVDYPDVTATCTVNVKPIKLTIDGDNKIENTDTHSYSVTFTPSAAASDYEIEWALSDTDGVTVDDKGNVKAALNVNADVTLSATVKNYQPEVKDSKNIHVNTMQE